MLILTFNHKKITKFEITLNIILCLEIVPQILNSIYQIFKRKIKINLGLNIISNFLL